MDRPSSNTRTRDFDYRHYSPLQEVEPEAEAARAAKSTETPEALRKSPSARTRALAKAITCETPLLRCTKFYLAPSQREGLGVFSQGYLASGEVVGVAVERYLRTVPHLSKELGSWLNHSLTPNCYLRAVGKLWSLGSERGYELVTTTSIPANVELTINYDYAPWMIRRLLRWPRWGNSKI